MSEERIQIFRRAEGFADRIALDTAEGRFDYRDLLQRARAVAGVLLNGRADLEEGRVAFIAPPGIDYVAVQWGVWLAGGVAVPLCLQHPTPELEYTINDCDAAIVVAHPDLVQRVEDVARRGQRRLILTSAMEPEGPVTLPDLTVNRRAMMIYTSGTTGKPKGVVSTWKMIEAQVGALVEAWEWCQEDAILHLLPLHHLHGIINVLTCALWSGARCHMMAKFDAVKVWELFDKDSLTLFMAVPTIYSRLTKTWQEADEPTQQRWSAACANMRLMVSGSAALPVPTLNQWREISGHTLLERYGMTEIGMALSNPLHGEREPGKVGAPLPGVEVRLAADDGSLIPGDGTAGEIQVRGANVFSEYWRKPEATAESFTADNWFKTGDTAVRENGTYRILGRNSVDIIKTGGYKVSALEIEEVLLGHPAIEEVAVVGVDDPEWGECVSAAICLANGHSLDLETLRSWGKERLAAYKVPTRMRIVAELPRNAMGKVTKADIKKLFAEG